MSVAIRFLQTEAIAKVRKTISGKQEKAVHDVIHGTIHVNHQEDPLTTFLKKSKELEERDGLPLENC